jgi:hypothetical protein
MQALPPNNQPLKAANASRLSVWICEGPKGIDSKLDALLPPSHTVIMWTAAACRVCKNNMFTTDLAGELGCAVVCERRGLLWGWRVMILSRDL